MNSLILLLICVVFLSLGYLLYSRRVDRKIIVTDPNKVTPAKMYMDGVDFIPTSRNVLFGYQFKSIAALGPILGVIIALQWGWLPALLWLLFGVLLIGWVQDYTSAIMSMRSDGQTLGGLSYQLISPRARNILLAFMYFYILLILAAFGSIVSNALTNTKMPLGIIAMTVAGILAGQMIHRWHVNIIVSTIITVGISFLGIWLGVLPWVESFFEVINGGTPSRTLFGGMSQATFIWTLVVFFFCYLGAVLPIWRWAQPINYVSFWIVSIGMLLAVLGIVVWHPSFSEFPAFTSVSVTNLGPIWPILFVTIACGAISGWHSLVSSSGTARQLERETDTLPVTGGVMFAETMLSIIALIIAVVAFGGFQGYASVLKGEDPELVSIAGKGPTAVFAAGLGKILSHIGIDESFGIAFGGVFLIIMAITVMQLALRFMRVASAEFLGDRIPIMRNIHVGSFVGIVLAIFLVWTGYWQSIWVLFGGSNQLMAALALMIVSIWLMRNKKPHIWVSLPAIFMYVTTIGALIHRSYTDLGKVIQGQVSLNEASGSIVAGVIAIFLIIAAVILATDAIRAIIRLRRAKTQQA